MMLLIKIILVLAVSAMTFQPMAAKKDELSYNLSRALEEAQRGNKQSAMEYFNKEVTDNPKNGYAYMAMAAFHMDNSDYGEARNAVESALKYLPKKDKGSHARVLLFRGQLLTIECDTVGAYSDMATAIKLDPIKEEMYEKRAQLLYEQGRYDDADLAKRNYLKAMDDICKALEIDSDSKAISLMFLFPKDQLNLIVTKLKGLSVKYPNTGEYEYYIALLYQDKRMFVQSNEALERSFDRDAQGVVLEMIADNYSEMGEYEIALETLDRAMQMSPDDDDLIALYADMLGESGDIEGAISKWGRIYHQKSGFCLWLLSPWIL